MTGKLSISVGVLLLLAACNGNVASDVDSGDPADLYGSGLCPDLATLTIVDAEVGERLTTGRASSAAAGMVLWRYHVGSLHYRLSSEVSDDVFDAVRVLETVDLARASRERPRSYRDAALTLAEIAETSCQTSFENGVDGEESVLTMLSRLPINDPALCTCDGTSSDNS